MYFRKKPVVIEAITFDELVKHGRENGGNIVNGMPWSFKYNGHPITHENDQCYLIPTSEGTMQMTPADMLITGVKGEIYPCKRDIFEATYDPVEANPTEASPTPDPETHESKESRHHAAERARRHHASYHFDGSSPLIGVNGSDLAKLFEVGVVGYQEARAMLGLPRNP